MTTSGATRGSRSGFAGLPRLAGAVVRPLVLCLFVFQAPLALADTGLVLPHPHRKHLAYLPFYKVLRDHDIAAVSRSRR